MVQTIVYNHIYKLFEFRENQKMNKDDEYKAFDMAALIVGVVIVVYALVMAFVF